MKTRRNFLKLTLSAIPLITLKKLPDAMLNNQLPNVLILGDSISIGYTPFVKELLENRANVFRPVFDDGKPENCAGTTKGVQNIERWLGDTKWDVIHFNFGLHDIKHVDPVTGENSSNPDHPHQADLKQYKKNLKDIVKKLKASNAKLVYATTTPYPDKTNGPLRKPGMPKKYNEVAEKIMKKNDITIDNLYDFVLPRMEELQIPNNVHFTEDGYKALAKQVADKILEKLN
ncbi:SGNH/GDSL hydrolase family protein [Maribellus comscasis]|uniref:SGNH/GDSL hydrolase family protein n=1 Tax=Maribellus comscasis TaxID=2681766 RepID=A0A6I6K870_9BACT|nr:SGNH/GDSL hydrolase family protein [Maribellus comscasis]QGY46244.1 SGNH/GDSL hydrolase family protein [Maribellus comscasis]